MRRLLATAVVLCAAAVALGRTAPASGQPPRGVHPAVCRVIVAERGAVSYGSGTLVGTDQTLGLVVTNWHVVRDAAGPIQVVFPDGFRSTANVLAADRHWDLAALAIRRPNVGPIALAGEAPRRGDPLTIAGYGSGWYKASTGRCTQYVSPGSGLPFEMVELDAAARQGDSGGPILNRRGELAGVLFGAGFGRTAGSHCGRVRRFLDTVADDFQELSSQSTMIAQRPPRAPAGVVGGGGGTTARDQKGTVPFSLRENRDSPQRENPDSPQPAPVAAITGGPYRLPSGAAGRQPPARRDLDELPVPRPYEAPVQAPADPARTRLGGVPVADVSAAAGPTAAPQPAGPTRVEQIKTLLAGIGVLAMLFHGMRMLGGAAGS